MQSSGLGAADGYAFMIMIIVIVLTMCYHMCIVNAELSLCIFLDTRVIHV
jgi:hypothetical protein